MDVRPEEAGTGDHPEFEEHSWGHKNPGVQQGTLKEPEEARRGDLPSSPAVPPSLLPTAGLWPAAGWAGGGRREPGKIRAGDGINIMRCIA